jgi:UDP-N-acetylglucosamine/UDP-N-acetylgalactosamine diphosphorylase
MTSAPTRSATEEFFIKHNYFGLDPSNIMFFNQGVLPAFDFNGKILLETKTSPAFSPDGNGGIYAALREKHVLDDMRKRGIQYIHCYCVDNCLVKVGDPVFIGYCISQGADCAAKSIPKKNPEEQVGVICMANGKPAVVEYSEISKEQSEARDGQDLVFGAANIANHFYTTAFLEGIKQFEGELEYHVAKKKIKHVDETGNPIVPTSNNGIKLELFIFDVFPFTKAFKCLEVPREDEFSPLKNKQGDDSPATSRQHILAQHKRWVESVGGIVDGEVEISPLVSYGGEGLEVLKGKTVQGHLTSLPI